MSPAIRVPRPISRGMVLVASVVVIVSLLAAPSPAEPRLVPGSAGTDTSLPTTESAVTVAGRGDFADLRITVNQTRDLQNQAVSLTWTGAAPTRSGPGRFAANYLQVMQCWGDDDGTVGGNPGPPPEQCVQGASDAVFGGRNGALFPSGGLTLERIVSRRGWANFDPADGILEEETGFLWKPFRAVDGTVIGAHYDPNFNPSVVGGNYWRNPYFNAISTNEIAGGRSGANGSGAELFEVTTGLESSGLGCGQTVQAVPGGGRKIPRCWLVVVPRGTPSAENVGTPFQDNADQAGVVTSPLADTAWRNRIAIPLEFNPVETPCRIDAEQRRIVGSELAARAISSWQPKLCAAPGSAPYAYGVVSDANARGQLANRTTGAAGMAVVSRPVPADLLGDDRTLIYAPVSLSGVVIGFNVERTPRIDAGPDAEPLRGVRVAEINLTPRLVAKLLSQSYRSQVEIKGSSELRRPWASANPVHLGQDPDFLQFNPEFRLLQIANQKNFGGFVMPARNSDAARQVWEWVLADPEASNWLRGEADAWGMRVNPVYAASDAANPSGAAFGNPLPEAFPKSDSGCFQGEPQGSNGSVVPPPLCGTDWLPYTQSLQEAARLTRVADDAARTTEDPFAAVPEKVYRPDGPQILGSRTILSITDSASAAQYGLQAARLSRSGDNGPDRAFEPADAPQLQKAVASMVARSHPSVLEPDPLATAPGTYPLAAVTYGVVAPDELDAPARADYAAFLDYAGGAGQVVGTQLGQLPPGYAPLPDALRVQAASAAARVRQGPAVAAAPGAPSIAAAPTIAVEDNVDLAADLQVGELFVPPEGLPATSLRLAPPSAAPNRVVLRSPLPAVPLGLTTPASAVAARPEPGPRGFTPVIAATVLRYALPALGALALLLGIGAAGLTAPHRLRAWRATR